MGISDEYHFAWHREIAALLGGSLPGREFLALAERRTPPFLVAMGVPDNLVKKADIEGDDEEVAKIDINDLSALADKSFDAITLFRAAYFIEDKDRFLSDISRVLRPGGTFFADWLHGYSDRPTLGFDGGGPTYDGIKRPFRCTYLDQRLLEEFRSDFQALISHINRPPGESRLGNLTRWLRRPVDVATLEDYPSQLSLRMMARGYEVVTEDDFRRHGFGIAHRSARYFYPPTRKFNLYAFTAARRI